MTGQPDRLWLVPVTLPGRYFTARLAVITPPAGTADDARKLAQDDIDRLRSYLPDADLVAGEPVLQPAAPVLEGSP
jgi:hypothetical protein